MSLVDGAVCGVSDAAIVVLASRLQATQAVL